MKGIFTFETQHKLSKYYLQYIPEFSGCLSGEYRPLPLPIPLLSGTELIASVPSFPSEHGLCRLLALSIPHNLHRQLFILPLPLFPFAMEAVGKFLESFQPVSLPFHTDLNIFRLDRWLCTQHNTKRSLYPNLNTKSLHGYSG